MMEFQKDRWHPIYLDSSLPFYYGDEFLLKRNACKCDSEDPDGPSCIQANRCTIKVIVRGQMTYGRSERKCMSLVSYARLPHESIVMSRDCVVHKYKLFKITKHSCY